MMRPDFNQRRASNAWPVARGPPLHADHHVEATCGPPNLPGRVLKRKEPIGGHAEVPLVPSADWSHGEDAQLLREGPGVASFVAVAAERGDHPGVDVPLAHPYGVLAEEDLGDGAGGGVVP